MLTVLLACTPAPPGATLPTPAPAPTVVPVPVPEPLPTPEVPATRAVHDGAFVDALVADIDAAEARVYVSAYVIYRGTLVDGVLDALGDAAERGVDVRVLADEEGDDTAGALAALAARGVQVANDGAGRVLHSKLVVVDDVAFVGSHNLTSSALGANHEGGVRLADPDLADWYAAWHTAVAADAASDPDLPSPGDPMHEPLADTAVLPAIEACVDGATEAVDLVLYAMAWDDAYPGSEVDRAMASLERAHARGVEVRVVLDRSDWIVHNAINDAAVARLRAVGVPVWRADPGITTHAKVLRCDDRVLVSDANWSYSGLALMHGTSVLTADPHVLQGTLTWMDAIRAAGTAVP
ncbi:MAG: phosphatidylserine/phosphatidylglycerophosphate/cardiolipin synthase family protein [Alphaproteobacteria bacterium]|nr:phosphatidylserine/phosphatidylglycerophosphate/cardiolipin synthase family protein [Alphaproteobacteria bacterium]MCB9692713.1 phosphatidylserine/phosphatidylglycerophosphate/cardiolipin synthase family protein [Alphaproteobacteria bacterium]